MRAKHPRLAVAAVVALLFGLSPGLPSAAPGEPLAADLDRILSDPAFDGADVGLVVRDAKSGQLLYDYDGAQRRQPASNQKMLTAASALHSLGSDYRFTTTVATHGRDLYLRGGGDPTMLAADYDALAEQVADAGIDVVKGKLVADDSRYDSIRYATGWAWDDEPYSYNAEISALTVAPDTDYDPGAVIIRVLPRSAGKPAKVEVVPSNSGVKVSNTAVTGAAGSDTDLTVDRPHGGKTFTVSGTIPADGEPDESYMAVSEPTDVAASVFRAALRKHGVQVRGRTTRGTTPEAARTVADHDSMTVEQLMTPFMKLSNNMHAEVLVKESGVAAGTSGSWPDGLAAVAKTLPGLGVDPQRLGHWDGSGLTRFDQVSPEQLSDLLVDVRDEPWFETFYDALPLAGAPDRFVGGTLRSRMRGTPAENNLRAKTGSLTGVSGLSGYVTAANGQELVFSMVSNQYVTGSSTIKAMEDAVGVRLAQYDGDQDQRRARFESTQRSASAGVPDGVECSWVKAC